MDLEVIITSYEGSGPARRLVGRSNVTIVGITAQEVHELRTQAGQYSPGPGGTKGAAPPGAGRNRR
jgi:hypothetical protein